MFQMDCHPIADADESHTGVDAIVPRERTIQSALSHDNRLHVFVSTTNCEINLT